MELTRRSLMVYGLLAAVWALVLAWQAQEHFRVRQASRAELSSRSKDIANTVSACIRGMRFRGTVPQDRLESVLNELVNGRSNELVQASELLSIALLNAVDEPIATAGRPIEFALKDVLQQGERWGARSVTFVNPVDLGASLNQEGAANPTVVLPSPPQGYTNRFPEGFRSRPAPRREPGPESGEEPPPPPPGSRLAETNAASTNAPAWAGREGRPREGEFRPRRPPWLRGMSEAEYQALLESRSLHGLVLAISTESIHAAATRDLWLRAMIAFLASLSAIGSGLAWRNLVTSSDLQIRLVRASELNSHLKEMNLTAAGLAHETRNPLNIVRGLAQMISQRSETSPEVREKALGIIAEADKITAQLNEFINYSRPREVRRSVLALSAVVNEVARALSYDLEEKQVHFEYQGEALRIEADDQLLRQALFNLLLNAIQAVDAKGHIQVMVERRGAAEAILEVRDDGPGVPPERRIEIFKPYVTMQKTGTGLGLAVVQQIVLAHGWEIECLGNQPKGAVFRISHLRLKSP
jgi:signal transduction histidine kinase